jgi:hypothetical protein
MHFRNLDIGCDTCIFARENFITREETSYEGEEQRTHTFVAFVSVRRRLVNTRHGTGGEASQVIIDIIIVGAMRVIVSRDRNVVGRKKRRH